MNPSGAVKPAVLTSWKEIAGYLGKGVRTVQRWENECGLPVRRPTGSSKTAILARPRDLDAWRASRRADRSRDGEPEEDDARPRVGSIIDLRTCPNVLEDHKRARSAFRLALVALNQDVAKLVAGMAPDETAPHAIPLHEGSRDSSRGEPSRDARDSSPGGGLARPGN